jgi:hypothetical protein
LLIYVEFCWQFVIFSKHLAVFFIKKRLKSEPLRVVAKMRSITTSHRSGNIIHLFNNFKKHESVEKNLFGYRRAVRAASI